jgi:hypothetical protein
MAEPHQMGRYAFFNTGFEYKFAFAEQPSADILLFEGTAAAADSAEEMEAGGAQPQITWTAEDISPLLVSLQCLADDWALETPNFSDYEKTVDGTWRLGSTLRDRLRGPNANAYRLGCLIYHQLLYKCPLQATWEQ